MPLSFKGGGWQAFVFNEQDQGSFECHHVCTEQRNCAHSSFFGGVVKKRGARFFRLSEKELEIFGVVVKKKRG